MVLNQIINNARISSEQEYEYDLRMLKNYKLDYILLRVINYFLVPLFFKKFDLLHGRRPFLTYLLYFEKNKNGLVKS
jgi:hypothetical protein